MNKTEYIGLLKNTIVEKFNGQDRIRIIRALKANEVIQSKKNKKNDEAIDTTNIDYISAIKRSIEEKDITIGIIEDYEYYKAYKYSALFEINDFSIELIGNLSTESRIVYNNNNYAEEKYDTILETIGIPTVKVSDDKIIFKFSLLRKSDRANEEHLHIKYTILAVIYNDDKILEIRMDNLGNKFKSDKEFYARQIRAVNSWLNTNLGLGIQDIDCRNTIDNILQNHGDEVKVYSQLMCTIKDAKAVLKVADDGNFVLPILGDLKKLIENNRGDFEREECKRVYDLINNFITEIEETCDLPRIALCWFTKDKDFIVEFTHNFYGSTFSLLQHYGRSQEVEGMEYVTKYIIENRTADNGEEAT